MTDEFGMLEENAQDAWSAPQPPHQVEQQRRG